MYAYTSSCVSIYTNLIVTWHGRLRLAYTYMYVLHKILFLSLLILKQQTHMIGGCLMRFLKGRWEQEVIMAAGWTSSFNLSFEFSLPPTPPPPTLSPDPETLAPLLLNSLLLLVVFEWRILSESLYWVLWLCKEWMVSARKPMAHTTPKAPVNTDK